MTNQHDIADECEHRLDEHYSVHSSINCKSVNVAELHADLARYAAHMRQQAAEIEKLKFYKEYFGEYATCLQELCMEKLYEPCKPVSHKWPGKKHVDSIVEAADFLLARIADLEKLVREAMPLMEKARVEEEFSGRYDMLGIWLSAARDAVGDSASER